MKASIRCRLAILQGLLGRMCGYQAKGAHRGVDIYVSPMAEDLIRKYSRAWQDGYHGCPQQSLERRTLVGERKTVGRLFKTYDGNKHIKMFPIKFSFSMIETYTMEIQLLSQDIT